MKPTDSGDHYILIQWHQKTCMFLLILHLTEPEAIRGQSNFRCLLWDSHAVKVIGRLPWTAIHTPFTIKCTGVEIPQSPRLILCGELPVLPIDMIETQTRTCLITALLSYKELYCMMWKAYRRKSHYRLYTTIATLHKWHPCLQPVMCVSFGGMNPHCRLTHCMSIHHTFPTISCFSSQAQTYCIL